MVIIPSQADIESQSKPTTPTVTSPTPPQTPASASVQLRTAPLRTSKDDLTAVHDTPGTPPVGAQPRDPTNTSG